MKTRKDNGPEFRLAYYTGMEDAKVHDVYHNIWAAGSTPACDKAYRAGWNRGRDERTSK